jgi:tetratricopeptide (TPR) repeat protein
MRRLLDPEVLVVLALVVRIAYAFDIQGTPTFASPLIDAEVYDRTAREIAARGPAALEVPYYQPPLYPMFLGAVYAIAGESYLVPRIVQAVLGALTVLGTVALARRGGGRAAGWIAGGLLALYGPVLYFEGELLPPALLLFLTTGALLLLVDGDRSDRPVPPLVGAGLLLGLAVAARPTALLLVVAALGWWLAGGREGAPGAGRGRPAAALLIAVLLPILPFSLANRIGGGEMIAISWNGGINFYLGNGAGSDSLTAIQPGHGWDRLQLEPLRAGVATRRGETDYWVRRALREASANPGAWAGALGRKALRFLDARETPRNTDFEAFRPSSAVLSRTVVGFGIVAPLAAVGLLVGRGGPGRSAGRLRSLLGLAVGAVAVENLLFFVTARYRVEAAPALCALAGLGVTGLLARGDRRSWAVPIVGAVLVATIVHVDFLGERAIDRTRVAINRGVALRRSGFDARAETAFREALRFGPGDPDAHRWLGEIELGRGHLEGAMAHFDSALAGAPDYLHVLLAKAQSLERAGRRSEAEPLYRRAIEVDPWSAETRNNYGVFLAIEGREDEARRQFEAGLSIDPTDERLARNRERLAGTGPAAGPEEEAGEEGPRGATLRK